MHSFSTFIIHCYNWYIITLEFSLGVLHSMDLHKYTMTYMHYSTIQNNATVLKILCALPIHPSLPITFDNKQSLFCLHSVDSEYFIVRKIWSLFNCLLHLIKYTCVSYLFFSSPIAHFFLALTNISFLGCTTLYPFTYRRTSWLLSSFNN
jgi:hypothetical protein